MGYELFRDTVKEGAKVPGDLSKEEHERLSRNLLDEPRLIVMDEAHSMKNLKGMLNSCTARFKYKSRLALTGSPLANNLLEYFALIDWVSPGYLGSAREFKAHYQKPIEEGLYQQSKAREHRLSLMKLKRLLHEIQPKVNRAGINVLRGNLKPKVRFLSLSILALNSEFGSPESNGRKLRPMRSSSASSVLC